MPVSPANHPLGLTIYTLDHMHIEPRHQPFVFSPFYYLETPRGDVARDLAANIGFADHPGLYNMKVTRAGDQVTIDIGNNALSSRYTVSLSQGCNPISCGGGAGSITQCHCTYENHDGIWVPKTWTQKVDGKDIEEHREVTFVENRVNEEVEPMAFALSRLGLKIGDYVHDQRNGRGYKYEGDGDLFDLPAGALKQR
jgi:hypothetical protein